MKRRTFIKTTSAGVLAGALMPRSLFAGPLPVKNIGLQLYSLRNEIKQDLEGSLEKISEIGYKNLEAADYSEGRFYGMEPDAFRKLVEKYGMKLTGSHLTFPDDEINTVLKAHMDVGVKYMVWPSIDMEQRKSKKSYLEMAGKFNRIGEMCVGNKIAFGYHNHDYEFNPVDGVVPYDLLLGATDPDLVFMELDLYWIAYAGKDPVHYFEKYPGRFKIWHVKDMAAGEPKKMIEVGDGMIDYPGLFELASLAGLEEIYIEQDEIEGDGFESVKKSFEYVKGII